MLVRLLVGMSGTRDGVPWPPRGSVMDLPDKEAADYCKSGLAAPMAGDDGAEFAVMPTAGEERRSGLTTDTGPGPGRRRTK